MEILKDFWQKKFFTLASVLWMATLSYRHFLTISCWPLDSSCSKKLEKVEKVKTQFYWSIWNSSISLNFGRPDSLTFCKIGECQRLRKNFLLHWFWWHFHSRLTIPILCAVPHNLWSILYLFKERGNCLLNVTNYPLLNWATLALWNVEFLSKVCRFLSQNNSTNS